MVYHAHRKATGVCQSKYKIHIEHNKLHHIKINYIAYIHYPHAGSRARGIAL